MGAQHIKHVVEGESKGLPHSLRGQEVVMYISAMSAAESGLFSGSLRERKHGVVVNSVKAFLTLAKDHDRETKIGSGCRRCRCAGRRSSACGPWGKYVLMSSSPSWRHARNEPPVRVRWGFNHAKHSFPHIGGALTPSLHASGRTAISRPRPRWAHLGSKGPSGFIYSHGCGHCNQGGDMVLHRWLGRLMPQWRRSSGALCLKGGKVERRF